MAKRAEKDIENLLAELDQKAENQSVTKSLHDDDSENYSYDMYNVTSPIADFTGFILEDIDDALSNRMLV